MSMLGDDGGVDDDPVREAGRIRIDRSFASRTARMPATPSERDSSALVPWPAADALPEQPLAPSSVTVGPVVTVVPGAHPGAGGASSARIGPVPYLATAEWSS